MNNLFIEFKIPIVLTAFGLAIVMALANSAEDRGVNKETTDYELTLSQNTEAIAQLEQKLQALSEQMDDRTSTLQKKVDQDLSTLNMQSVTVNKAMGRISARIAAQSKKTTEFQALINGLDSSNKSLVNHTQTLDSAVVQQHRRHQRTQKLLADQQSELKELLELNTQLGDLFNSAE